MNTNFTTNAFNFTSSLQTQVDSRIGQFLINLPIANLEGNKGLGPNLELSLSYSPLSNYEGGFGQGFSLSGITYLDFSSHSLTLSNGENYKLRKGTSQIKNQKIKNFKLLFKEGTYSILWKEGDIETLEKISEDLYVTKKMTSPLGKELNLQWKWTGSYPQLISVKDNFCTLLDIDHKNSMSVLTLWPDKKESYTIKCASINGNLNSLSLIAGKEVLNWYLEYSLLENSKLAITKVTYPNGLKESVQYSQSQGLKFPLSSNLPNLPAVISHTTVPGQGQSVTQTNYSYTSHNFLGFNSNFGDWSENDDYIYTTLTDYTYGSTATTYSGEDTITVTRTFNNYHLQISEETYNKDCVSISELEYYAIPYVFIDHQPNQFQLPKRKKYTWKYRDNSKNRSQSEETEFDEEGNLIYSKNHEGIITQIEWYDSEGENGCPEEPNGFKRFMKSKTVIPTQVPEAGYEIPISKTIYTYKRLKNSECIIKVSESNYLDNKIFRKNITEYEETLYENFGRIKETSNTLFDIKNSDSYETKIFFSREEKEDYFIEKTECINFDGIRFITEKKSTLYRNLLMSETNSERIETIYSYDDLSRIISKEIIFPNLKWNKLIHSWEYESEEGILKVTQKDQSGNSIRESFNSLGKLIKKEAFDSLNSKEWYEIESFEYNSLNEVVSFDLKDWITSGSNQNKSFGSKGSFQYDKWGNLSSTNFKNNIREINEMDIINLTSTETREYKDDSKIIKDFKAITHFDENLNPIWQEVYDNKGDFLFNKFLKYDGQKNVFEEKDELGNITRYTYDTLGRLENQILCDGSKITREYAPYLREDHVTSLSLTGKNYKGEIQKWVLGTREFDSLGRVKELTVGGRTTYYEYKGISSVPVKIIKPSGEIIENTLIPELGDKIGETKAEGISQNFEFDPTTGFPIKSRENNGSELHFKWSEKGDLIEELTLIPNQSIKKSNYTQTLNGQKLTEKDFTGKNKEYIRNDYGLITKIIDDEIIVDFEYDEFNKIISEKTLNKKTQESITTSFTYNNLGQEIKRDIIHSNGFKTNISQKFNKKGQLIERDKKDKYNPRQLIEEFEYDERSRLINYCCSGKTLPKDAYGNSFHKQEFTYDALNNITSLVTHFSEENNWEMNTTTFHFDNDLDPTQLTSIHHSHEKYPRKIELKYDANGYLIQDEEGRVLSYDTLGRLISIKSKDSILVGEYYYDSHNRIIQKKGEEKIYSLYYQNNEISSQIIDSSEEKSISRLIKEDSQTLAMSLKDKLTLSSSNQTNTLIFTVEEGEAEGNSYTFSPYGEGISSDLIPAFNGEIKDPFSKTYFLGNGERSYSPKLMRFTSPDIMSPFNGGGINPYSYCLGDPVNNIDPSGNMSWQSWVGIGLGILSIIATPLTGGASTAAMVASIASITSDIIGITGIVIDEVTEKKKTASILGWVSLGLGLTSIGITPSSKLFSKSSTLKNNLMTMGGPMKNFDYLNSSISLFEDSYHVNKAGSSGRLNNRLNIIAHGSLKENGTAVMTTGVNYKGFEAEQVFNFIKDHRDLSNIEYIRTIMCHSGNGGDFSFGQKLANVSGKEVKSYIGTITVAGNHSTNGLNLLATNANHLKMNERVAVKYFMENDIFKIEKINPYFPKHPFDIERIQKHLKFRYDPISFRPK